MKRFIYIIMMYICSITVVLAQIKVVAPQKVSVGEQFRLQYIIQTTDVKGFRTGSIPDAFDVLMGPSKSVQQSFKMVNGHTSSSESVTFTYILSAEKNGNFIIPPATAKVEGKDASSQSIKIVVSGTPQSNPNGGQQGSNQQRGAQVNPAGSRISGNDLFIKVSANKQRVHEQEPVLLTYKVYTQVELTQLEGKMPDLTGFHTQEVTLPQQKSFHLETVNGRPYRCVTWSQYVMYPQMTGKLEIPSISFKGIVVQENTNIDPFEAFFNGGSGYVEIKKEIKAPGMTIQVDPLPTKPDNFSGGVGKFSISSTIDKKTVAAGNPVTVRIVISGNGNLKLIKQPELNVSKDFDKYDAKVIDKTELTAHGLSGSMIYDFLIVPHNQGDYEIPSVEFVYFDTQSNNYKTIKTSAIPLKVEKGDGKQSSAEKFNENNSDIHGIHNNISDFHNLSERFFGSTLHIIVTSLIIIIFIIMLMIFRKRALEMADVTMRRGKKANKVANVRLKRAEKLMIQGKSSDFYDEVLRALWGYVSDKLSIHISELSRDNIIEKLSDIQIDGNIINSFIEALDECEFERYAPGDPAGNMQKTYDKAVSAITNIEDSMNNKKRTANITKYSGVILLFIFTVISLNITAAVESNKINKNADRDSVMVLKYQADDAYIRGDYKKSIEIYNKITSYGVYVDAYYNLANAYYRCEDYKYSVLNYHRALLLSPGNSDILHNLELAQSKTIDRIHPEERMFFMQWYDKVLGIMSIDTWAKCSIYALIISLFLFLIYLFVGNIHIRKIAFYVSAIMIVLFAMCNIFAWQMNSRLDNSDGAVVMANSANVMKSPSEKSSEIFVIHEGTYLHILDASLNDWIQIKLDDGREGWMRSNCIEKIAKF